MDFAQLYIDQCWRRWELVRKKVEFFLYYKDYLNALSDCSNSQMGDPYLKFLLFIYLFFCFDNYIASLRLNSIRI